MQYWFYLLTAILLEVLGTALMKFSQGFTKVVPSVLMIVFFLASLVAFTFCLKKIEMSIAYAVWAGLGTALIAIIGIIYFHESVNIVKIASIVLIIAGVVGLNLSGVNQ